MNPIHLLAVCLLFSSWIDRMWNFAIGLYLIKLTPGSLQLAAIYGLVSTSISIVLSPVVGDWLDKSNRLKVVRLSILIQNSLVICSALTILVLLCNLITSYPLIIVLRVAAIVLGSFANLIGQGEKISISKDWIVVVCQQDTFLLAQSNALFRRIDLTVAILAPMLIGLIMSAVSDLSSILLICGWNIVSFIVEYCFLTKVYKDVPNLSSKKINDEKIGLVNKISKTKYSTIGCFQRLKLVLSGWKTYKNQSVVLAGISLSLLYFTALGFNSITTGYAYSQGLKEIYISICFGLGSFFGIFGTFLYPILRSKVGLVKSGLVGFYIQLSMLSFCVVSIWLPGNNNLLNPYPSHRQINNLTSIEILQHTQDSINKASNTTTNYFPIILFMIGIILSRIGLWIIDLGVSQIQQENVKESERGVVGGVQYALNSVFDLAHFISTIFLPMPSQFGVLILMSFFSISVSAFVYHLFCYKFSKKLNFLKNDAPSTGYTQIT